MSRLAIIFLALLSLLLSSLPVLAQQPLPASPWYAVVYQPETDTLHWINAQGEQGQMPRPRLSNETEYLGLRISPNGRTMLMVVRISNGQEALGIYDFVTGSFIGTYLADPGQSIHLGGQGGQYTGIENIFTPDSQFFAVGFYTRESEHQPSWRLMLFDTQTGQSSSSIHGSEEDIPDDEISAPYVQYMDGLSVHFQLIPQGIGGSVDKWPAYAWRVVVYGDPAPIITESPYTRGQIQPLMGKVVRSYADASFPKAPQHGQTPNFNAIGAGTLVDGESLTPVHVDVTRYQLFATWAKGGEWILFLSTNIPGNKYWNAVLANGTPGNNSHIPFDPKFTWAYGTSDGYLLTTETNELFYSSEMNPINAPKIAQLSPDAEIVHVTPMGISFTLSQLPYGQPIAASPTDAPVLLTPAPAIVTPAPVIVTPEPLIVTPVVPPVPCAAALASRVAVGGMARVELTTSLNVRQQPGGKILDTYAPGTTFFIIAGSACVGDLYWWQIERFGAVGWVAEGVSGEYLIEPYAGPMTLDATETPPVVVSPPPAAPTGCEQALPPRLSMGGSATVQDTLRPHTGPGGEIVALRFYQTGTRLTVNAGPECVGGQYWWLVTGEAKIGRVGNRTEATQGWVSESANGTYYLAP